jgi:hypothetical protein
MNIHLGIIKSRRLVRAGIMLGYAGAVALTIIRFANTDVATVGESLGSVAMGLALASPATLALLSLDRRPTLLPAAAIAAVVTVPVASVLLPIGLITAFMWYRAWTERPVPATTSTRRAAMRVGLGFVLLAAILTLSAHVDPACTQRLTDGTERSVDAASRGFDTGWAFNAGGTTSGSMSIGPDASEETCTSDTVVVGEALVSLLLTALVLEAGRRWPEGLDTAAAATPVDAAAEGAPGDRST